MKEYVFVALGLGSNLGDREGYLRAAARSLVDVMTDMELSPVYETPPFGAPGQGKYLNAAVVGRTKFKPPEILGRVKAIEKELGRQERGRWAEREIDIDILFYGEGSIEADGLQVPHPHLHERETVLLPLAHIMPQLRHPVLGETVEDMLARVNTDTCVLHHLDWREPCPLVLASRTPEEETQEFLAFGVTVLRGVVDPVLVADVFKASEEVFSAPEEVVLGYPKKSSDRNGGYVAPGEEKIGVYGRSVRRQSFDVVAEEKIPPKLRDAGAFLLRERLVAVGEGFLERVDGHLAHSALAGVKDAPHPFRLNKYADLPVDPFVLLFPPHTDYTLATFLMGDGKPGLQVKVNGRWWDVTLPLGDVLAFRGSVMTKFDPRLRPLRHRVVASDRARLSAALFFELHPGAMFPSGESYSSYLGGLLAKTYGR